jgi:hypothetical protein
MQFKFIAAKKSDTGAIKPQQLDLDGIVMDPGAQNSHNLTQQSIWQLV